MDVAVLFKGTLTYMPLLCYLKIMGRQMFLILGLSLGTEPTRKVNNLNLGHEYKNVFVICRLFLTVFYG